MGMTPREVWMTKCALRALDGAGPAGLGETALLEQTGIMGQSPLTRTDRAYLLRKLAETGWADRYTDPLTGNLRWTLSEDGHLALGAL